MTQLLGEREGVDLAAAGVELVRHVEQHQRGQADGEDGRSEHELAVDVRGVEDEKHQVRARHAGHATSEDFDGDARVFRVSGERVDAGEIDEREVAAADGLHAAGVMLHGDAGIVGDLLAHAGEAVEEGGFAGVRRTDERDCADAWTCASGQGRLLCDLGRIENGARGVAVAHRRTPAAAEVRRRKMWHAVSLRRPTSTPSMR